MGGFTFMAALATAGILVAIFFAALAVFIVATVISIVFAARTKKRREQGKSLGALIAIPIVLYVLSAPTVLFGLTMVVIPSYIESVTTTYNDCTSAVVKHNPEELEHFLENPSLQVPDDGKYGNTPLYNACSGFCSNKFNDEPEQLAETEEAIDVLLEAGADTSAINEEGMTSWDAYQQTIREYEESGAITSEEATALLSERSEILKP